MASLEALEGGSFVRWNDPYGNPIVTINRDGTIGLRGVSFFADIGSGAPTQITGAVPIVQSSETLININTAKTVTATSPINTLYEISLYADSRGTGGGSVGDNTLVITINWVDPSGFTPRNLVVSSTDVDGATLGSAAQVQKTLLAEAGSVISVATTFGGNVGTPFQYDLAVRIVAMP